MRSREGEVSKARQKASERAGKELMAGERDATLAISLLHYIIMRFCDTMHV